MASIIEWYKKTKSFLAKDIRAFGGGEISNRDKMPFLANWMYAAKLGMPRQLNLVEVRQYAKSAWVQMVENAICKQIMTTEWDIVHKDEEIENLDKFKSQIDEAKTFLEQPNRNGDSFWDIWIPWLRDVLEIDAGVVYKGKNVNGKLVELFTYDGGRFLINVNEHGIIGEDSDGTPQPGYYQYSFRQPMSAPVPFDKEELIYGRMNTNTEAYPYGFSPLQSLQQEVEVMIQSTRFNKERFANSAVPDGIVSVPMDREQMTAFKSAWENEIKGKPHKLLFHNSEANFTPLAMSNKDMEWLDGQKWYFHLVFAAYGLSPQEVGFYENSNKSTGESQERITIKNAIKPYLTLIEQKINREILPELLGTDELMFKWFPTDDAAEKIEHEQTMAKLNANVITINEIRAKEGLDPVEWGDQPMSMVMQDRMIENGTFDGKNGEENPKEERDDKKDRDKKKEEREEKKSLTKEAGPEMVEEADDYEDFLKQKFGQWEKEIFSFLDRTITEELHKDIEPYMEKSFGEFIRQLFNRVNTVGFINGVKKAVKISFKVGVDKAEKELNMDIGFSDNLAGDVSWYADRQLEGFYIDGKRWNGLKGVASDLQLEVSQVVRDGIVNRESMIDIKNKIKERLDVTNNRATMIARTETTRFQNHGKLESYKKSGVVHFVKWEAFLDDRTSSVCRELHKHKPIPLGNAFNTTFMNGKKQAMWEGTMPPAHPNCRSEVVPADIDED